MDSYYCIFCSEEVTSRQEALLCEGCDKWQHRRRQTGITREQYRDAVKSGLDIPVRTNNDIEGWHHSINRRANGRTQVPFYLLVDLLHQEARLVTIQIRFISEGKLSRIQRRKYRLLQARLFTHWDEFSNNKISALRLLKLCSYMNGPRS